MIIGFLGKGGSGKSTLASRYARFLHEEGDTVLAIDADHNMDMTYNLGRTTPMPYIGESGMDDIFAHITKEEHYNGTLHTPSPRAFALSPRDAVTEKYTVEIAPRFFLMASGPHTNIILSGDTCSHSLTLPLKSYLPLVSLADGEHIVIDERAGVDGVGTGITSGFDIAIIVTEPTIHGIRTAQQIASMLDFYKTPYYFALNKSSSRDEEEPLFLEHLSNFPDFVFPFDKSLSLPHTPLTALEKTEFEKMRALQKPAR